MAKVKLLAICTWMLLTRALVVLTFLSSSSQQVPTDVDRLMLRGDVLSTFGGGANTTAGSDD
ncbi:MAG: hypothetical protein Q9M45_00655 [Robiginitomaculum sp.]|nr:hypothetical protein [Robiginitomaculum sp.]